MVASCGLLSLYKLFHWPFRLLLIFYSTTTSVCKNYIISKAMSSIQSLPSFTILLHWLFQCWLSCHVSFSAGSGTEEEHTNFSRLNLKKISQFRKNIMWKMQKDLTISRTLTQQSNTTSLMLFNTCLSEEERNFKKRSRRNRAWSLTHPASFRKVLRA